MIDIILSIIVGLLFSASIIIILHRTNAIKKISLVTLVVVVAAASQYNNYFKERRARLIAKERVKRIKAKQKAKKTVVKVKPKEKEKPKQAKKVDVVGSIKKKYKKFPEEKQRRKMLISDTAGYLQQNNRSFSISQLLSTITRAYPNAERGELVEQITQWVNEDPNVQRVSKENEVTYYEIQTMEVGK